MVTERSLIAVVDDDPSVGKVLGALLRQAGHEAHVFEDAATAMQHLGSHPVDLVITDLRMPGMDGFALLDRVGTEWPDLPVVVLTAHGATRNVVEAMRRGAVDFLTKPFDREAVTFTVARALGGSAALRSAPPTPRTSEAGDFLAVAPAMRTVVEQITKAASSRATVLLLGETGTGKEIAARVLHARSPRRDGPFLAVHCGAIPETLIESELFGYEKGAFTGASTRKPGRVELADGGTLFLDEVGDTSPAMQVKLLRLLQEREYQPLGAVGTKKADVRFVAATHHDLEARVAAGLFREDLYYRLAILPVVIPPLRERPEDVPELARRFAERVARRERRMVPAFSQSALAALVAHDWPGNVRELENLVERLVILEEGSSLDEATVTRALARAPGRGASHAPSLGSSRAPAEASLGAHRSEAERQAIVAALEAAGGNRSLAARLLGVSRRTLYTKMTALAIQA